VKGAPSGILIEHEAMLAHKLQQRQMGLAFCPLTAYTYVA
jgi:hypothetical protein